MCVKNIFSFVLKLVFVCFLLLTFQVKSATLVCETIDNDSPVNNFEIYEEIANSSGGLFLTGKELENINTQLIHNLDNAQIYFNSEFKPNNKNNNYQIPIDSAINAVSININRINSTPTIVSFSGSKNSVVEKINKAQCIYQDKSAINRLWKVNQFNNVVVQIESHLDILSFDKAEALLSRHGWGILPLDISSNELCSELKEMNDVNDLSPELKKVFERSFKERCNNKTSPKTKGYYWVSLMFDGAEDILPQKVNNITLYTQDAKIYSIPVDKCNENKFDNFKSKGPLSKPIIKGTGCYLSFEKNNQFKNDILIYVDKKYKKPFHAIEVNGQLSNGENFRRFGYIANLK